MSEAFGPAASEVNIKCKDPITHLTVKYLTLSTF